LSSNKTIKNQKPKEIMKIATLFATAVAALALSLHAESDPKADLTGAAKKLADQPNYGWRTTVVVPEDSPFHPGPTDGQTEKDGFTHLTLRFGDNTTQAVLKGEKAAATSPDGDWQSLAELESAEGPARFLGLMLRNFKTPASLAAELVSFAKDLKKEGDVYSADLTEEGAKSMLTFRFRGGSDKPSVSNAKGSVKFWLKDGALVKLEFKLKGTVSFNGNDFENDRTTTVELKAVGSTKVEVPEAASKKLS
jgi:hypothetical protein